MSQMARSSSGIGGRGISIRASLLSSAERPLLDYRSFPPYGGIGKARGASRSTRGGGIFGGQGSGTWSSGDRSAASLEGEQEEEVVPTGALTMMEKGSCRGPEEETSMTAGTHHRHRPRGAGLGQPLISSSAVKTSDVKPIKGVPQKKPSVSPPSMRSLVEEAHGLGGVCREEEPLAPSASPSRDTRRRRVSDPTKQGGRCRRGRGGSEFASASRMIGKEEETGRRDTTELPFMSLSSWTLLGEAPGGGEEMKEGRGQSVEERRGRRRPPLFSSLRRASSSHVVCQSPPEGRLRGSVPLSPPRRAEVREGKSQAGAGGRGIVFPATRGTSADVLARGGAYGGVRGRGRRMRLLFKEGTLVSSSSSSLGEEKEEQPCGSESAGYRLSVPRRHSTTEGMGHAMPPSPPLLSGVYTPGEFGKSLPVGGATSSPACRHASFSPRSNLAHRVPLLPTEKSLVSVRAKDWRSSSSSTTPTVLEPGRTHQSSSASSSGGAPPLLSSGAHGRILVGGRGGSKRGGGKLSPSRGTHAGEDAHSRRGIPGVKRAGNLRHTPESQQVCEAPPIAPTGAKHMDKKQEERKNDEGREGLETQEEDDGGGLGGGAAKPSKGHRRPLSPKSTGGRLPRRRESSGVLMMSPGSTGVVPEGRAAETLAKSLGREFPAALLPPCEERGLMRSRDEERRTLQQGEGGDPRVSSQVVEVGDVPSAASPETSSSGVVHSAFYEPVDNNPSVIAGLTTGAGGGGLYLRRTCPARECITPSSRLPYKRIFSGELLYKTVI